MNRKLGLPAGQFGGVRGAQLVPAGFDRDQTEGGQRARFPVFRYLVDRIGSAQFDRMSSHRSGAGTAAGSSVAAPIGHRLASREVI